MADDIIHNMGKENLRANTEEHLEKVRSVYKFHFFFTALVFAILSFAIQFPVSSDILYIKLMEALSWLLIAATALLALKQIGGFSSEDTKKGFIGLGKKCRTGMWVLFFVGVSLLLSAKILNSLI
jgi:hypothetical protein